MKVKYGDVWLTGVPWQEDAGVVQWNAQQVVQNQPLLRGTAPFIAGRGNVSDTLSLPIHRSFGTNLAALKHQAELPWNLPNHGTLILYEQEGSDVMTVTYSRAAFNGVTRRRVGQTGIEISINFLVKGSPTVETTSAAAFELYTESGQTLTTED